MFIIPQLISMDALRRVNHLPSLHGGTSRLFGCFCNNALDAVIVSDMRVLTKLASFWQCKKRQVVGVDRF